MENGSRQVKSAGYGPPTEAPRVACSHGMDAPWAEDCPANVYIATPVVLTYLVGKSDVMPTAD